MSSLVVSNLLPNQWLNLNVRTPIQPSLSTTSTKITSSYKPKPPTCAARPTLSGHKFFRSDSSCVLSIQSKNYHELVVGPFERDSKIFLQMDLPGVKHGESLQRFLQTCSNELAQGFSPVQICDSFLQKELEGTVTNQQKQELLFAYCQYLRRLVSLHTAIENSQIAGIRATNEPHSMLAFSKELKRLLEAGTLEQKDIESIVKDLSVGVIFTAHPTQSLDTAYSLAELALYEVYKREGVGREIASEEKLDALTQLAQTYSRRHNGPPTPLNEAEDQLPFFEHFYRAIPNVHHLLECLVDDGLIPPEKAADVLSSVRIFLGSWAGADRDGNPFVTAQTTKDTAAIHHQKLLELYIADLGSLLKQITQFHPELTAIKKKLEKNLYNGSPANFKYSSVEELKRDVQNLIKSAQEKHLPDSQLQLLKNFLVQLSTFGFHYASLEIRQNSSVLEKAIDAYCKQAFLDCNNYCELTEDKKEGILEKILSSPTKPVFQRLFVSDTTEGKVASEELINDTFETFKIIADIQLRYGERALRQYNISNTTSHLNVLEALVLKKLQTGQQPLDIVPLFESEKDLDNSYEIMKKLFDNQFYKEHLQQQGNTQVILFGFSDTMKDAGSLTAVYKIKKAKEALTRLAKECNIKLEIMDGRGGDTARGGCNTAEAVLCQGSKVSNWGYRLTTQGAVRRSHYGTEDQAMYNIEQLVVANLKHRLLTLLHSTGKAVPKALSSYDTSEKNEGILALLSDISSRMFRETMASDNFYESIKTISDLWGALCMASRPPRRTEDGSNKSVRAIPLNGATAAQGHNSAAHYPLGDAIAQLLTEGNVTEEDIHELFKEKWMQTFSGRTLQSLLKANWNIAKNWSNSEYKTIRIKLAEAGERTVAAILQYTGQQHLLENDPLNRESILVRTEITDALRVILNYAFHGNLTEADTPVKYWPEGKSQEELAEINGNLSLAKSALTGLIQALRNV
jgi:phosphoenolpyruvate carboxylase